ncbi:protein YIPF7 isoform X6 [Taeniopygia guttata]|uniref:protein YIPF7 isoform X6 n=1 Tax=Taeniopygia guttata TaxID=59729 RepID=UPI003BB94CD4
MSSFEQFHVDFYQSNYTIEDQEEGCNSYGSGKNFCESRKSQAEKQPAGAAFVPSDMLPSSQSYSGQILQPAYSPDTPSQLGYVDGFDEEPPLLEGRKSSFWLRVWDERHRVPCHARPAEPDERLGSLARLRRECPGLLPAAHGHPVLFCSCLLAPMRRVSVPGVKVAPLKKAFLWKKKQFKSWISTRVQCTSISLLAVQVRWRKCREVNTLGIGACLYIFFHFLLSCQA